MTSLIKQTVLFLTITTLVLSCFSNFALAQDPATPEKTNSSAPVVDSFSVNTYLDLSDKGAAKYGTGDKEIGSIAEFIVKGINYLSLLIGSFSFLAIVVGGFLLVTSGGLESQLQRGKDIIKFAIIGLIVTMLAFFIVSFVQSIIYEYGTPQN